MTQATLRCCVCGDPANPNNIFAKRAYCDRHWSIVNKHHMGYWRAGILQIVLMGLFSLIVAVIASNLPTLDGTPLVVVGLLLAAVPTLWWLAYFYHEDQIEPEPKTRVAEVFFLALLLTYAVGLPLINGFFQVPAWSGLNRTTSLLAFVLILGFTFMAIEYFTVRVIVYASEEFDERMDGVVYGTTAGLGVATLLNLNYIVGNGGVDLGPGVIHVVTTALAQASFGGLMGYFMAQAKFEHKPVWWVPVGLSLAAVLNGLFLWLITEVSVNGLSVDPWRSLVAGLLIALGTFIVLVALMRRANRLLIAPTST